MIVGQSSSCLVRLVLSLQLFQADDSSDKLDVLVVQEILVLSLRIFGEQTHRGGWWRGKRGVREVAAQTGKLFLSEISWARTGLGNSHSAWLQALLGGHPSGVDHEPNVLIFRDKSLLLLSLLILSMVGQKGFDGLLRLILAEIAREFGDDLGGRGGRSGLFNLSGHRNVGHRGICLIGIQGN